MCRIDRKVRMSHGVHWSMIVILLPASIVLTYMITGSVDARTLLFWVAFIGISEVVVMVMNRISMICQYCGFDPILYRKNRVLAMQRVKDTIETSKARFKKQPLEKNAYHSLVTHLKTRNHFRTQSLKEKSLKPKQKLPQPQDLLDL